MHKVHFIGIAGVGMSATALLLQEAGHLVTGSDAECYSPAKELLAAARIPLFLGYAPENIPADVDEFVIGRNAKLAPEENAEVRAALASGKPVRSFPEVLGELTKDRVNLVVAGSYGKSTVTALIAHILRHAGIDAGYFVGAEPVPTASLPAPAKLGTAPEFILEGDEYPSAHDDPRAKFMHLHPHDILLTSVVHDHVNVYPTFDSYLEPFEKLIKLIPNEGPSSAGMIVACTDEPGALGLALASGRYQVTYGIEDARADFRAVNIRYGERTRFALAHEGIPLGEIETSLLGAHNIENIVGAAAWILTHSSLSFEQVRAAVADFEGVRRRLDNIAKSSRVPVFEGFGSSYEKARAAIEAMQLHFPARPLVIVFEPHTFGWRNRANLSWYDTAFDEAERVWVAAPETQGAKTHDQLTHEEILARIGAKARAYARAADVAEELSPDAVVLILSSGSLGGSIPALAEAVAQKFPR